MDVPEGGLIIEASIEPMAVSAVLPGLKKGVFSSHR